MNTLGIMANRHHKCTILQQKEYYACIALFPGPAQLFLSYSIWKSGKGPGRIYHVSDAGGKEDLIEAVHVFPKCPQREVVTLDELTINSLDSCFTCISPVCM